MRIRFLKPLGVLAATLPAAWLVRGAFTGGLGANPIDKITDETGVWTLRFLLLTLAVTPVRRWLGWNELIGLRRTLGLFAFGYGVLHFATYFVLDHFFDVDRVFADVVKRPFVTAGFTGFVLMIPLAITSTRGWIRRLGRRWQQLHRLAYASAIAGVVHYLWLVKADLGRPLRYAAILVVLLGARLVWMARAGMASRARRGPAPVPEG